MVSLHWRTDATGEVTIEQRDSLTGFELDEDVVGRPVDVAPGPDGSIYVSDDMAGAIYRIRPSDEANGNVFAISTESPQMVDSAWNSALSLNHDERERRVREGEQLYSRHGCATCHRGTETRPAAVSLVGLRDRRSVRDVTQRLRTPPASMPRSLLTDDERSSLAIYLLNSDQPEATANR